MKTVILVLMAIAYGPMVAVFVLVHLICAVQSIAKVYRHWSIRRRWRKSLGRK